MPVLRASRDAAAQVPGKDLDSEVADLESCRELLFAVIALAIRDAGVLEDLESKSNLTEHERKAVRELTRDAISPREFFESEWFEMICALVSVSPETIRRRV